MPMAKFPGITLARIDLDLTLIHMGRLTSEQKAVALERIARGDSLRMIAKDLKCTHVTLSKLKKRKEKKPTPVKGRLRNTNSEPTRLTVGQRRLLRKIVVGNPHLSIAQIRSKLIKKLGSTLKVSRTTVWREVTKRLGIVNRPARRVPMISKRNREARRNFAKIHIDRSTQWWSGVCFSDESVFRLVPSGRQRVWRFKKQRMMPRMTQKRVHLGGGGVHVWGCITSEGPGPLVRLSKSVTKERYRDLWISTIVPFLGEHPEIHVWQEDNAPPHKAIIVKNEQQKEIYGRKIEVMKWPAQSPDMNVIENAWGLFKARQRGKQYRSADQLWHDLEKWWKELTPAYCKALFDSLPRRMTAVKMMRGHPTNY